MPTDHEATFNDTRVIDQGSEDRLSPLFENSGPLYLLPSLLEGLFPTDSASPDEQKSVLLTLAFGETYVRAVELQEELELLVLCAPDKRPSEEKVLESYLETFQVPNTAVFATFASERSSWRSGRLLVDMRRWFCGCDQYFSSYHEAVHRPRESQAGSVANWAVRASGRTGICPEEDPTAAAATDVRRRVQIAAAMGEPLPLCAHIFAVLIVVHNQAVFAPGVRYATTPFE